MRWSLFTLPFLTAIVSAGHFEKTAYKVRESIERPPHGWIKGAPAPSNHLLRLKIALPQPHFPILENHLSQISDPDHARYGAHLSKEETDALISPHPETLDVVNGWLSSYGIEEEHLYRSHAQDWVTVRIPVALVEEMLDTKYHVYTHSDSGESLVRTMSYSLPEFLHQHVELIQPTTMFSLTRPFMSTLHFDMPSDLSNSATDTLLKSAGGPVDASCKSTVTIRCLRQLYNAVGYKTSGTNGNKIAVTAYLKQYANNKDLQQFFQLQNPAAYKSNYTFVSINGGLNNQSYAAAGGEANLDTQFAYGLTFPTPATFYSTGGSPPYIPDVQTPNNTNEPYTDWLDYMLSREHLPQTISTSYGDHEQTIPPSYAVRVCSGFAALGARGVSLLFSSGDTGVGDGDANPATQKCFTNTGANRTIFLSSFPATCPFVTSVGATYSIPEIASKFSGGGFSDYFSRPDYQNEAVSKYLDKLSPDMYKSLFNRAGRGFPDVAAQGEGFQIIYKGKKIHVSGTSCSSPTFASFISMLNDARINAGKPPLGFLNPWLYKKAYTALNDITVGNNPGCGTQGFHATTGWDPVTGFGTPNFQKLLALALAA